MTTVSFKTFGCRLNHAETAQFEAGFSAAGFVRQPFGKPTDVVVIHTCAVTQRAENECLKLLRFVRRQMRDTCLVVVGCAVEADGAEALLALGVDLVVTRDRKETLVTEVAQRLGIPYAPAPLSPAQSVQRAVLKVQDGCDFFCSYCIVPHTRGAPVSRPFDVCLGEAQALIAAGFHEIVVTGCNTACYSDTGRSLVDLLRALLALPGLGRLRLGSIEPGTIERDVVALMAESPKFCRFLHLPIQSGDNGVLSAMRRRYTREELDETLRDALRRMPRLGLGADVICGFPGETADAFAKTREFVEAFPFSKLHVFPYSERPGTPAAEMPGTVPMAERKRRTHALIDLSQAKRATFARAFVGHPVTFLPECVDGAGHAYGWSGEYLPCVAHGVPRERIRTLCTFTPTSAGNEALYGEWSPTAEATGQSD